MVGAATRPRPRDPARGVGRERFPRRLRAGDRRRACVRSPPPPESVEGGSSYRRIRATSPYLATLDSKYGTGQSSLGLFTAHRRLSRRYRSPPSSRLGASASAAATAGDRPKSFPQTHRGRERRIIRYAGDPGRCEHEPPRRGRAQVRAPTHRWRCRPRHRRAA